MLRKFLFIISVAFSLGLTGCMAPYSVGYSVRYHHGPASGYYYPHYHSPPPIYYTPAPRVFVPGPRIIIR